MDSPKVWRLEANERGKIILERMQSDIRIRKAEMPKTNPDGFSGRFNNPSKSATDEQAIQKVRTEAKTARAKVPTDMRAEPYAKSLKSMNVRGGLSGKWEEKFTANADKTKKIMGSEFNKAATCRRSRIKSQMEPKF